MKRDRQADQSTGNGVRRWDGTGQLIVCFGFLMRAKDLIEVRTLTSKLS